MESEIIEEPQKEEKEGRYQAKEEATENASSSVAVVLGRKHARVIQVLRRITSSANFFWIMGLEM